MERGSVTAGIKAVEGSRGSFSRQEEKCGEGVFRNLMDM
jgi:hypothetical protein